MRKYFLVNDFITDASFIRHCYSKSKNDQLFWDTYLAEHPEQRGMIEYAASEVLLLRDVAGDIDRAESLEKLKALIEQKPVKLFRRSVWIAAAAVITICVSTLGIWFFNRSPAEHKVRIASNISYSTNPSQKKIFKLPDGSVVQLNAASVLTYGKSFNSKTREITLRGEGYFDVVHQDGKPFIIHTKLMDVKVLGTSFNVKAYNNDHYATTVLVRGLVEVTLRNATKQRILLRPSEKITVNQLDRVQLINEGVNEAFKLETLRHNYNDIEKAITETSWTRDQLIFTKEPLERIVTVLERWYNVKINIQDQSLKQRIYTASFNNNESLDSILKVLQISMPFKYTRQENKITIKP